MCEKEITKSSSALSLSDKEYLPTNSLLNTLNKIHHNQYRNPHFTRKRKMNEKQTDQYIKAKKRRMERLRDCHTTKSVMIGNLDHSWLPYSMARYGVQYFREIAKAQKTVVPDFGNCTIPLLVVHYMITIYPLGFLRQ